jgi:LacI family transcriptional regulator
MHHVLLMLSWYDPALLVGAMRYAQEAGWHLDSSHARMGRLPTRPSWDGVITSLPPAPHPMRAYVDTLTCPVVDIDAHQPEDDRHHVLSDDHACGRLAAEHFLERGFRHLICFADDCAPVHHGVWRGFQQRALAADLPARRLTTIEAWSDGCRALPRILADAPKPLGLVAIDDDHAVEALLACDEARLHVPEEVAVLGINNSLAPCMLAPICPLSSVDADLEGIAWQAGATLDLLMRGEPVPERIQRHPPRGVVLRRSTDTRAFDDLRVARAVRLIRDRFHEGIGLDTLAEAVGCSRRTLSAAVHAATGQTVLDLLTHERVAHAQHLAATTTLRQDEIARRCGYASPLALARAVRRRTGTTWRDLQRSSRRETPCIPS